MSNFYLPALSLCQNELPYDFYGTTVTTSGNYQKVYTSWQGCDSIVQQNITVMPEIPPTYWPELILTCGSAPIDFFGQSISSGGTYQAILQSWQGCDSIIILPVLEISPYVDLNITSSAGTVLPLGGSTILEAVVNPNTPFSGTYEWSTGESGQTISVDQPGYYTVVLSFGQCAYGADITITQASPACPNFNLPIAPADSCATAPSFCGTYLSGYCSANDGYTPDVPGNLASVIPCTIENNQWLKFTACDTVVQLEFAVINCQSATGLEFFILQTDDCQVFTAPQACFTIADGNSDTLTVGNLIAGQTYYLMVDGIQGDICHWEVLSTAGISFGTVYQEVNLQGEVVPLDPADEEVCGGETIGYGFTPPVCGILTPVPNDPGNPLTNNCPPAYQQFCEPHLDTCITIFRYDSIWTVTPYGLGASFENNDSIGSTVNVVFPSTAPNGEDSLIFYVAVELVPVAFDTVVCWNSCVLECSTILPSLTPCDIKPRRVKVCFPDITQETRFICPGECVDFHGQSFCLPGTYTINEQGDCGCENSYTLILDWFNDVYPIISQPNITCSSDGTTYTVSLFVEGFGAFVTINNQPLFGNTFTSGTIPSGEPYNFVVSFIGVCLNYTQTVSGTHTCQPCTGGTNNLGTIPLCPSECYNLLGNSYCIPGNYSEVLLNPATNCNETYVFELVQILENELVVGQVSSFCDATNLYYQVGFPIESGTPPYMVNGNVINGSFYQSGLIPSGQPYAFTITDAAICAPETITIEGIYTCNCVNNPGTTQFATLYACEDNMVSVQFNNDAVIGNGDLFVFILHSDNGASLGQVVGMNTTGDFGFVPGVMTYGQTYRISPAVGPDLGGTVDMNAACFQFAPGQKVVFYEKPEAQVLPHDTLDCAVNSLIINSLVSNGSGDYQFEWSNAGSFNSAEQNPTISQPGAYTLLVTDKLTGCTAETATIVESDVELPIFTLTSGEINCQAPNVVLEAASQTAGVTYTWAFPTGDQMTGAAITTNLVGEYKVTALAPNGCLASATTLVAQGPDPLLTASIGLFPPNCFGEANGEISVSDGNGGTAPYAFSVEGLGNGQDFQGLTAGNYLLQIMDSDGCTSDSIVVMTQPEQLTVSLGDDQSIHLGESVSLAIQANATPKDMLWSGPNGETWQGVNTLTINPLASGSYTLLITDENDCQASDEVFVHVSRGVQAYLPTAFSPNGDGVNDRFTVFAGGDVQQVSHLQIFDRWGEMVFEAHDFAPNDDKTLGWDGRHHDRAMDPALYIAMAEVVFLDGTKKLLKGEVVLVK
ncbi:MAG: gliding motility-associated C-terminal domain-containing protein [Saprospiraceae bacterium]|nr:gliding motility-associated C-terminal domain-containing protein [Saprospiraceae bacterium]